MFFAFEHELHELNELLDVSRRENSGSVAPAGCVTFSLVCEHTSCLFHNLPSI